MSAIIHTLGWQALAEGLAATGTYDSIAAAVEAGAVVIEGSQAVGGFSVISGGAGATVIDFASALEVAKAAELTATATDIGTASVTLAKTATGFKTVGLMSMTLPTVAAAAAPLAGAALGAELYRENPALWTKISETLLPFCYSDNMIHAFLDFVQDPLTSEYSPIVTIPTAIIDALKSLFESEDVQTVETINWTNSYGSITGTEFPSSFDGSNPNEVYERVSGEGMGFKTVDGYGYSTGEIHWTSNLPYQNNRSVNRGWNGNVNVDPAWNDMPVAPYTFQEAVNIISGQSTVRPPTAGVDAPSVPVEPTVWPFPPIIIVPEPLGPDYQPIPVTPIVPELPPYNPPLLPEPVPDPTPEEPPEEWPEEDPWPTVIPSPFHEPDPSTEPDPNIPYIPWPLTPEKPDEDTPKPEWWPDYPPSWPGEWPEEVPWPESPEDWPEEVPWPDTKPEWWPDDEPWPETPEDWPEEIPWPDTKPEWWPGEWPEEFPWPESPEDWPEEVPWPDTKPEWWPEDEPWPESPEDWPEEIPWPLPAPWPFPWPDDEPYPWPYPYPEPSPNPYPDPYNIPDPNDRVDPRIDPWPWPYPDPRSEPNPPNPLDPTRDPSQPDPTQPDPTPRPDPDPDPPPPSGTINPSPPPIIPLPFSSTTGLISVYHPTQSELLSFCQWLWVTWQDATIDKIWNNPFDGVITLFELYCTPTDVGRKNIRSGFLDSGVSSETISRYTSIDCGSIGVPEYYGDYLDYAPYSKCHIYLPFIGIVELNVDDVVGHGVNVTYRIDEYNGSCIAMITVAKSTSVNGTEVEYSNIMYQFSGNCAVDLPIAGGSQAAIKAGMLEAAAWGLGSVIGGIMGGSSPLEIGADLAQGAASAVHSVVSAKSSVQHSGSFGSSFGALGNKKPFIIVTRPKQIQVPNYQALYGYPAHKMVRIGDCTGYLRCREVHVISPQASDEEKAQIEQLLKTGVYVTE